MDFHVAVLQVKNLQIRSLTLDLTISYTFFRRFLNSTLRAHITYWYQSGGVLKKRKRRRESVAAEDVKIIYEEKTAAA